jgi:hypothetical protein
MLRAVATRPLPLVIAVCAVLAACGDQGPSEEEQVRATLEELQRGTAAGDYGALCEEVFARRLVDTVEQVGLECEDALEKGFEDVREPRLTVGAVSVDGDTARAQVRSSAAGQAASDDTVELVKEGATWRIASLGRATAP